jgi:ubiquinone/menaquinone biosynthesis C-methylase UbiE
VSFLLDYFGRAAGRYDDVEPAFEPLAVGLVHFARLGSGQCVLDVGTGTGLAARQCVSLGSTVFALDFSRPMLESARRHGVANLFQTDSHHLAAASNAFDVVLASFALNSTDPVRSLAEMWRVLVPGGQLALQEWGVLDPLSGLVSDTVAGYAVEDPPPDLAVMRASMETRLPWDNIDGPDDIVKIAEDTGFRDIEVEVVQPAVTLPRVEVFLRYKLAWPDRRAEIDAMPPETRRLCLGDLQENLAAHAEVDGSLIWQPQVFRIRARK